MTKLNSFSRFPYGLEEFKNRTLNSQNTRKNFKLQCTLLNFCLFERISLAPTYHYENLIVNINHLLNNTFTITFLLREINPRLSYFWDKNASLFLFLSFSLSEGCVKNLHQMFSTSFQHPSWVERKLFIRQKK